MMFLRASGAQSDFAEIAVARRRRRVHV